jgi:serine/threonine-protein kinase
VKVLDFGLARPMDRRGDAGVTQEGEVLGTPEFMPPETLDAPDLADARSDIYSLGAVAFNLLTGQPPFSGGSVIQVLLRQRDEAARPPSTVCEVEIPQALDDIVLRCLEKRPEDRIQTTRDLADMLDAVHGAGAWTQKEARDWWQLHIEVSPQSLTENPS